MDEGSFIFRDEPCRRRVVMDKEVGRDRDDDGQKPFLWSWLVLIFKTIKCLVALEKSCLEIS